ncbi:MAG: VCBS repeat-containing protein [Proteobacteria bacterium]|nr:VCBS repeat-containing protein [Pseudomonadota bacterium]
MPATGGERASGFQARNRVVRRSGGAGLLLCAAVAVGGCDGPACGAASHGCASPGNETIIAVAVADLNGDDRPDVAAAIPNSSPSAGLVGVFLHAATNGGAFLARDDTPVTDHPYTILPVDLNGDGLPDLVATDVRVGIVSVLLNSATAPGTFLGSRQIAVSDARFAVAADLDGDGRPDLLVASDSGVVALLNGPVPGEFAAPILLYQGAAGSTVRTLAVGDLNGDGVPDVVVSDDDGVRVLVLTRAGGTAAVAGTSTVYTNAVPGQFAVVAVADIDGDGANDVIIADQSGGTVTILPNRADGSGTFLPPARYPLPAEAGLSVVVADLNGDGRPDLVIGGPPVVAVLLQDASRPGTFLDAVAYHAPIGAGSVAVGDVNGDGLPDIVTNGGVSGTQDGGVIRIPPGVLYQDSTRPGTFLDVRNLE